MSEETPPSPIPWTAILAAAGSMVLTAALTVLVALERMPLEAYLPIVLAAWGVSPVLARAKKLAKKEALPRRSQARINLEELQERIEKAPPKGSSS